MAINRMNARRLLAEFRYAELFVDELNWSSAPEGQVYPIGDSGYKRRLIAEMSGVAVLEVFPEQPDGGLPKRNLREKLHRQVAKLSYENVLIFLDDDRRRAASLLYWVKRENGKRSPRCYEYLKEHSCENLMSRLDAMFVDMDELRDDGTISISKMTGKLATALDIERVTKKFYDEFRGMRLDFIGLIDGIADPKARQWYGSVLLNRLMFIYFLQKKGFIQNNLRYLDDKLKASQQRGSDRYYSEFLAALFFEGFAKPAHERSPDAKELLGPIPYLNGGLFLRHALEREHSQIRIPDRAFANVLRLFGHYSWYLDAPGDNRDEINPEVLGYIFEKYINQKAFGAYYTRSEITNYLCEKSIHSVLLEQINQISERAFDRLSEALLKMKSGLCRRLLFEILPRLSLLDPACGSGAFLVAAMKNLHDIYAVAYGRIDSLGDRELRKHKQDILQQHPSLPYYIRKQIITCNLYGVDIMDEAAEIARLRLFLALVSAAHNLDELEPLPNIDFNIMAGNSLIGLLNVDETRFDGKRDMDERAQQDMLQAVKAESYRSALNEKNRLVRVYRGTAGLVQRASHRLAPTDSGDGGRLGSQNPPRSPHRDGGRLGSPANTQMDPVRASRRLAPTSSGDNPGAGGWGLNLQSLRDRINDQRDAAQATLNDILLDDFRALKIQYEQAQLQGRAKKRALETADIAALQPFHWGYEFDEIIETRGGFDVIITNPPWEVFKPQDEEFFAEYSDSIRQKRANRVEKRRIKARLLDDGEIRRKYLDYQSGYRHVSAWYRGAPQYENQISRVNGRKQGTDINLYKLFTEQCFNLLRAGGACGIVIPSGIYSDLGTKQLRQMLFDQTGVIGLFGIENRRKVFEGVDSRFKFVVLNFVKGQQTDSFPAAFMRHDVAELERFPSADSLAIGVDLIKRSSPSSLSVTEFKSALDLKIAEKMLRFPLLGEALPDKWNVKLYREFDMTNDSDLFHDSPGEGRLPLYEGKMIWQFEHGYAKPRYWIDEAAGRARVLGKRGVDDGQTLDYQMYRLGFRDIASATNERTMIMTVLPPNVFCNHKLPGERITHSNLSTQERLLVCALLNSFVVDHSLRQRVNTNLTFFVLYQTPIPRLTEADPFFAPIVERAARLICTAPAYDALAAAVGLGSHVAGVTDAAGRARLRAELDGMIAHVYGLSEAEFAHVLGTFPLVNGDVKLAALAAFRGLA